MKPTRKVAAKVGASQSDGASLAGEQRYRHLFENLPICSFVADLTVTPAVIVEINARAALLYGYAAARLVGKPADHQNYVRSREIKWFAGEPPAPPTAGHLPAM